MRTSEGIDVLDGLNTYWIISKLDDLAFLWNEGHSLPDIAKYFKRSKDETFLAIFHLAREGKIKARENGLFGKLEEK